LGPNRRPLQRSPSPWCLFFFKTLRPKLPLSDFSFVFPKKPSVFFCASPGSGLLSLSRQQKGLSGSKTPNHVSAFSGQKPKKCPDYRSNTDRFFFLLTVVSSTLLRFFGQLWNGHNFFSLVLSEELMAVRLGRGWNKQAPGRGAVQNSPLTARNIFRPRGLKSLRGTFQEACFPRTFLHVNFFFPLASKPPNLPPGVHFIPLAKAPPPIPPPKKTNCSRKQKKQTPPISPEEGVSVTVRMATTEKGIPEAFPEKIPPPQ